MESNPRQAEDFFASPALSLSLAGVFKNVEGQVDEGEEASSGGVRAEPGAEISSENTGTGWPSDDEADTNRAPDKEEDSEVGNKKRKKYHRHTTEQIKVMEALFKESPHPDEKQRQELSKHLGLDPKQIKFWFQNRRTQIKAMQERHENSILKSELEKLREENHALRETINNYCCPNCGFATSSNAITLSEEQQLRIENARLKEEVETLRGISARPCNITPVTPSSSNQTNRSSLDSCSGSFGLEKSRTLEILNIALDELLLMATMKEPLWVQSLETGREILNYDEYIRQFKPQSSSGAPFRHSIEASRETGIVFLDISRLVQAFMDVNQWKDMFSCMIASAATVSMVVKEENSNLSGTAQLMYAELQMLTPLVPTREYYYVRYSKQLSQEKWAILDVSIDKTKENTNSTTKSRKHPSGCIMEDMGNGHCKVTWVEHVECEKSITPTFYRSIINNGIAFGARHWMATLQLQCERMVFSIATNVPTKDSNGVSTLAGRRSILRLAQRMSSSFHHAVGASRRCSWSKMSMHEDQDIRYRTRKNTNDPGEPIGLIVCAVSSTWLPLSSAELFDYLKNEPRRKDWDLMLNGADTQTIVNLSKGQDRGNSVTVHTLESNKTNSIWVLQDSSRNSYESMLVYAPIDAAAMQSAMNGIDPSNIAVLPSGFSILPDDLEDRPCVISSRAEQKNSGGTLLTIGFQIIGSTSPSDELSMESIEAVKNLISSTLHNIKSALQCKHE